MLKKIEALRKAPRHVRNAYAFWIALFMTLIILVVWASTIPARFAAIQTPEEETPQQSEFDTLGSTISNVLSGAFNQFGNMITTQEGTTTDQERIDFVELLASSTLSEDSGVDVGTTTATSSTQLTASSTDITASTTPQSN